MQRAISRLDYGTYISYVGSITVFYRNAVKFSRIKPINFGLRLYERQDTTLLFSNNIKTIMI